MIYGIGTDISDVRRFKKWVNSPELISRFFAKEELFFLEENNKTMDVACRHYAARFAAKEAFVKALGTGFVGIELKGLWVSKNEDGKPFFSFNDKTKKILDNRIGNKYNIQLSISHEKEYAVAFVLIEKSEDL